MASTDSRVGTLEEIARGQETRILLLTIIAERQNERLEGLQVLLDTADKRLEEVRRDANQTQRLWVRLCQKYGWIDDLDLDDGPAGA